ncbi:MAG: GNAT family N-acetyltransferase [Ginsengibacter sp.]
MLTIKSAGLQELTTIQSLAHEIWPLTYRDILSPGQLEYMIDKIYSISSLQHQLVLLKHKFILAFNDGKPVAFASYSADDTNTRYKLQKIYVLPGLQGTGTGKFILNNIINIARVAGAVSIELNVNRHNKAKRFYENFGFKIMEEADIDIGQGYYMNDYIMKLEL